MNFLYRLELSYQRHPNTVYLKIVGRSKYCIEISKNWERKTCYVQISSTFSFISRMKIIEIASPAIRCFCFRGKPLVSKQRGKKEHLIACYKSREFIDRVGILGILRSNFKKYWGEVRLLTFLRGSLWSLTYYEVLNDCLLCKVNEPSHYGIARKSKCGGWTVICI